jgi:predicted phosphodiesterase
MIVVLGDTHIGHGLGLSIDKEIHTNIPDLLPLKRDIRDWFCDSIRSLGKIDVAFWMGDIVDGEGRKEHRFHDFTDVGLQIEKGKELVKFVGAKHNIAVYGTPYHTGCFMDYEKQIFNEFGGNIRTEQRVEIDGVKFQFKHATGKSGTPVGGDVALRRAEVWDKYKNTEHADIILRGHAHEYRYIGNEKSFVGICPALQIGDPNYYDYARKLEGNYSFGFLSFETDFPDKHIYEIRRNDEKYSRISTDTKRVAGKTGKRKAKR